MRKQLFVLIFFGILGLGGSSCKKCYVCTDDAGLLDFPQTHCYSALAKSKIEEGRKRCEGTGPHAGWSWLQTK